MKTHTSIDSNRLTAAGNRQLNTSEMQYVTVTACIDIEDDKQ